MFLSVPLSAVPQGGGEVLLCLLLSSALCLGVVLLVRTRKGCLRERKVAEAAPAPFSRPGRRHLVVAEADPDTQGFIRKVFNDYDVDVCQDGEEALKIVTTTHTDAVITGLRLVRLDGFRLCRRIKGSPSTNHIPVIVLAADADGSSELACAELGADRFFVKPVSAGILRASVAQAISVREMLRNKMKNREPFDYGAVSISPYDETLRAKILSVIARNIGNAEFGVAELSREIGISRVHLNRKLKEMMDVSPSALIKNVRLKQAAWLLVGNENPSVSEVAYRTGFSSPSYFSTAFRNYFGFSPTEFVSRFSDSQKRESLKFLFEGEFLHDPDEWHKLECL